MEFQQWFINGLGWLVLAALLLGAAVIVSAWCWHRAGADADRRWDEIRRKDSHNA